MRKKLLAMALSVCMIFTMLPIGSITAYAVSQPGEFKVNIDDATEIAFGTDGSGNPRLWRVIGADGTGVASETGSMTLFAKDVFGASPFDITHPYTNNYSGSNLQTDIENSVTFTTAETGLIVPVTLTGGTNATAEDGMYGDDVTDAKLWPLSVTEANAVNVALRKAGNYWWLRSPGTYNDGVAAGDYDGIVHTGGGYVGDFYGVRPAFKLNLASVLFASAAAGGESGTTGAGDFTENSTTTLNLRFSDNTVLSSGNASVSASGSTITYTAPADSILVVEATAGGKTYQARKNIDTVASDATLDLKTIAGLPDGAVTVKVWIEKMEDTVNNKGLIYAIAPTDVSYTAGLSDAEKVAAAKTAIETAIGSLAVSDATTAQDVLDAAQGSTLYGVVVAWDSTAGFNKTDATSSAAGSITGTLNLTLNSASDTIAVSKSIAQLPVSDAEKVAAAKTAIETAIGSLAVSNATTAQDVLDAAQGSTLHGVVVAWDSTAGFNKTDATSSAAGSITGTLNVTLNSESDTISVNKAIAKLSSGNSGSSSGGGGSSSSITTTATSSTTVQVNGESQSAGTTSNTTNSTGQTVTTVTVDTEKLEKVLEAKGEKTNVTILVTTNANVAIAGITGQMIKSMEGKKATIEVKTDFATYHLPATEINIDDVSQQLGQDVKLSNIKVQIQIAEPPADSIKVVENSAKAGDFTIMVPPVNFEISCTYNGKSVDVNKFNSYVERTITIPDGVDPTKITTGVVVEPDGTVRHVPTQIIKVNGKYVVKIKSLTNSTYMVIWNPIAFADVENYWAKDSINNMGSRMVVSGVGNGNYSPNSEITRAEFAAIVVRALGLEQRTGENQFSDVKTSDWFCGYVEIANEYGIINGKSATIFAPNDRITREQGMAMIARAMKITGIEPTLTESEINTLLSDYVDANASSSYAKSSIASCLKTGVISGTSSSTLAPNNNITRAEVAVIVERLLKKSELI